MKTSAESIMTRKLQTVKMGTSVYAAQRKMHELRIRHLPVVDELDDIVGLISSRDLKVSVDTISVRVEDVMTSPVEFVDQKTPLRTVIFKMLEKKISCVLIADENENAAGIVTTDDLLWFLAHQLDGESDAVKLANPMNIHNVGEVVNELSLMGI